MSVAQLAGGKPRPFAVRAARRDPLAIAAAVVLGLVVLVAVVGPLLAPYDPTELYVGPDSSHPTAQNLLGTDDLGRDILSRLLTGARASVFAPVIVVLVSTVLGSIVAIGSAWFGGVVDAVASRLVELIFAIPGLVLAVLAVAIFGKGLVAPIAALSIAYIPIVARLIRTVATAELGKPYIAALRVQGVGSVAICFRHVIPALLPAMLAQATVGFGYAMLDLAAISYLGLGEQPPAADWGVMIADGQTSVIAGAVEQSFFAALMIVITVLSVNIVGARLTARTEAGDR